MLFITLLRALVAVWFTIVLAVPSWSKEIDQDLPLQGISSTIAVDQFTGQLTGSIPLEVPPGRNGMQPNLALTYSSTNGMSSVGEGWKLELGAIERQTRFGVIYNESPADNGRVYTFRLNGVSADLVKSDPNNPSDPEYRAKIEGAFIRFRKLNATDGQTYWEVTDKMGRKYVFGQTSSSRLFDPSPGGENRIFKWSLDEIQDLDGNYLKVYFRLDLVHVAESAQIYMDRIEYGGKLGAGALSASYLIKFNYRDALEWAPAIRQNYTPGFKVRSDYMLQSIEVKTVSGSKIMAYSLGYTQSPETKTYLLAELKRFGSDYTYYPGCCIPDPAVEGNSLPATTLTYHSVPSTDKFEGYSTWTGCQTGSLVEQALQFVDVDGDGKQDFTWYDSTVGAGPKNVCVAFSTGTSFVEPYSFSESEPGKALYGDLNGDGKNDFVYVTNASHQVSVRLSLGRTLSAPSSPLQIGVIGLPRDILLGDLTGDGRDDLVYYAEDFKIWIAPSNGTGFDPLQQWGQAGNSTASVKLLDLNGDGKLDVLVSYSVIYREFWAMISSGIGLQAPVEWGAISNDSQITQTVRISDFNGDGLPDLFYETSDEGLQKVYFVRPSTRTSFAFGIFTGWGIGPTTVGHILGDPNGDGRSDLFETTFMTPYGGYPKKAADLNGDGKTDVAFYHDSDSALHVRLAKQPAVDLLASVSNGMGGRTLVKYGSSAQVVTGPSQLSSPIQVVTELVACSDYNTVTSTCNASPAITTYAYSGGFYHFAERDFRGFKITTVTSPGATDAEKTVTTTWFHQGNEVNPIDTENPAAPNGYMKGKPYRVKVTKKTDANYVYSLTETTYLTDSNGQAPWFTPPAQVVATIENGAKHTKTVYVSYDDYGNVTREDHYGDATSNNALTTDDYTIVRTFLPNLTAWIVGLPTSEIRYKGIGTAVRVAQTDFLYDGAGTDCSAIGGFPTPSKGHLSVLTRVHLTDAAKNGVVKHAYDAYGNPLCRWSPSGVSGGSTTAITYDSTFTFPRMMTNQLGHTVTLQYYGVDGQAPDFGLYGLLKSVTDPNGRTVSIKYDTFGRKIEVTEPTATGTFATSFAYLNVGQGIGTDPVSKQHIYSTNPLNVTTWTFFDGFGRAISTHRTGPGGGTGPKIVVDTQYDVRGLVSNSSVPYFAGGTPTWQTLTHDPLGRRILAEQPSPSGPIRTRACFDQWVSVTVDANNHWKRRTQDAYGRLAKVEEFTSTFQDCPASLAATSPYAMTEYRYDALGNLTRVIDAKNNETAMTYDSLGHKTSMHDPDMGTWSYEYDAAGNLTKQTDAKGQVTCFTYDALNRRTVKSFGTSSQTCGSVSGTVTYLYDGATAMNRVGRLASAGNASGTMQFRYDPMGRVSSFYRSITGGPNNRQTEFTYDGLGRLSTVRYPNDFQPGATGLSLVNYTYDGPVLQRVWEASTNYTYAQYSTYSAQGQPGSVAYGNGTNTTYTYEPQTFRMTSFKIMKDSSTYHHDLYGYAPNGNVGSIHDVLFNGNRSFGYDALDRLQTASYYIGGETIPWNYAYTYDQIGNLLSSTNDGGFPGSLGSYAYPPSGPFSLQPHAVCATGATSCGTGSPYTYDSNGNLIGGGGRTIDYDMENHPICVATAPPCNAASDKSTIVYDGEGTRVKKTAGTNPATFYYNEYFECMGTGCVKYIWANGQRIAMRNASWDTAQHPVSFFHSDHLGSTRLVTSMSGVVEQMTSYHPFGATLGNGGTVNVPYKYTGQELDETGLYDYHARLYDPVLGRFISADTIVPDPTDPQSLNRYSYVRNNPLSSIDPTGHADVYLSASIPHGLADFNYRYSTPHGIVPYPIQVGTINGQGVYTAVAFTQGPSLWNAYVGLVSKRIQSLSSQGADPDFINSEFKRYIGDDLFPSNLGANERSSLTNYGLPSNHFINRGVSLNRPPIPQISHTRPVEVFAPSSGSFLSSSGIASLTPDRGIGPLQQTLIDANTLGGLLGRPTSVDVPGVIGGLGSILAGKIEIGVGILLGPTTGVGLFGIGAGINDIYQGSRAVYDALYVNGKSSTVLQTGSNLMPLPGQGTLLQIGDRLIMQPVR